MKVGYLVNQYPKVSHTFIRREIRAVEAQGVAVERISIRPCPDELADEIDREEFDRTRVLLGAGAIVRLIVAVVVTAITAPVCWGRALILMTRVGQRSEMGVARHMIYFAEACVLRRWLGSLGCTHVHAHFATNPTTVAMACHALGGPTYSFTMHGTAELDRLASLSIGEKIRRATFVATIAAFTRGQLLRWCDPADAAKVKIVRCGLDASFLTHAHVDPPLRPRFVTVGRLSSEKGHDVLLDAAARLADAGHAIELVLVGDGPERPALESLIEQRGLGASCRIVGWASGAEVAAHIIDARALVLPSYSEGLPVVVMEALALGRPVIASAVGAVPELVEPGRTGWLVPAGEAERLAAAMAEALDATPKALARMGAYGAEQVTERHDATREAARLVYLFSGARVQDVPVVPPAYDDSAGRRMDRETEAA